MKKSASAFFPFHNKSAVAVALTFMVMAIMYGSWIARLPDIKLQLGLGEGEIGFALIGLAAGSLIATPLSVYVLNFFGTGRSVFLATLAVCAVFTLPALAVNALTLFLLLSLVGMCDGILNISMNAAATALEKHDKINILSTCHGMFSVGLVIGPATSGWVSQTGFSFFWHIVIVAALMIIFAFLLRPHVLPVPESDTEKSGLTFPSKAIIGLGVICLCFNVCEGAIADWSGIYLRESIGSSAFIGGLGLAIFSVGMSIGRFGGDKIRALLRPGKILLIGGIVSVIGLCIVTFLSVEIAVLVGFFIAGLGLSVSVPVLFSLSTQTPGVKANVGLASVATFSMVGFMSGPPLIGFIAEASDLHYGFAFTAFLAATGVVLILLRRI